jgi:hypothetical protein
MQRATRIIGRALISAIVMSLLATATGWSRQPSLTWLGTLGGRESGAEGV